MERLAVLGFAGAVLSVLYVLAGYPLLLWHLARRKPREVRKAPLRKTVSVVLPVLDGERWIRAKLESILALDYPRDLLEVLVVDNGSRDRSAEIAGEFSSRGVRVLRRETADKGLAINLAVEQARGEILFFTDVRQALAPSALAELVNCFADPEVGAASGEVVIREGETEEEASVGLYRRYENWLRDRLSRLDSIFGATGCIWALRRELAVPIPAGILLDDVYLPLAAFFGGYRLIFDGSAKAYDYPTALSSEFRRKVRTLAGVCQAIRAWPALLGPRNRLWIHFVSYKFARLGLPWALILAAGCSFGLPAPWMWAALSAQGMLYGAAAVDPWIPNRWRAKRVTATLRTFVVLMAATACAIWILFRPNSRLWKPTEVRPAKGSAG